jgi:hypothetical protein
MKLISFYALVSVWSSERDTPLSYPRLVFTEYLLKKDEVIERTSKIVCRKSEQSWICPNRDSTPVWALSKRQSAKTPPPPLYKPKISSI